MSNSHKIKGVKFQPWIGKNYKKGGLLLFGESHYDNKYRTIRSNYTTMVVNNHFNHRDDMITPLFRKIESVLQKSNSFKSLNDVAFANGIQRYLIDSKAQPNKQDFESIGPAFTAYVHALKPSKVLILSKRIWEKWLPKENWEQLDDLKVGDKQSELYQYSFGSSKCYCIGIYHPSSRYFSLKYWTPLVLRFLNI